MKAWLRFYFGIFFSNKAVNQNIGRSFANAALTLLLAMVTLFLGLFLGNIWAFPQHLEMAESYTQAIQNASDHGMVLSVNDGTATSNQIINTFDNQQDAAQYKMNDVELVVDTRNIDQMYVHLRINAIRDGEEISYDTFLGLSDDEQESYRLNVQITNQVVDLASFRDTATAFLDSVADTQSPNFQLEIANEYRAWIQNQSLPPDELNQQLYVLYARAYFPDLTEFEMPAVPTLHDYYTSLGSDEVQYLIVYSEMCIGSFESENSTIDFMGYFSGLDGFSSEIESMQTGLLKAFRSAHGATALIYVINLMQMFLYVVFLWVILSVVVFLCSKLFHIDSTSHLFGDLTVVGCFLFVTSAIAGTAGFITSFFASQEITYLVTTLSTYLVFIARTLFFLIPEIIKQVRINKVNKVHN